MQVSEMVRSAREQVTGLSVDAVAATLASIGYDDVAHLDGGITAWAETQRPIVRHATS